MHPALLLHLTLFYIETWIFLPHGLKHQAEVAEAMTGYKHYRLYATVTHVFTGLVQKTVEEDRLNRASVVYFCYHSERGASTTYDNTRKKTYCKTPHLDYDILVCPSQTELNLVCVSLFFSTNFKAENY